MATTDHIQAILERMPHEPGVYQHFDGDGKLLYIGKAKNLKKRVASYFTKPDHTGKTRVLVKKIRDVQWIVTASEADALLLENNMITDGPNGGDTHFPFHLHLLESNSKILVGGMAGKCLQSLRLVHR